MTVTDKKLSLDDVMELGVNILRELVAEAKSQVLSEKTEVEKPKTHEGTEGQS